jgi:hypothetical protein
MFSLENSDDMIAAIVQSDVDMRAWDQTPLSITFSLPARILRVKQL